MPVGPTLDLFGNPVQEDSRRATRLSGYPARPGTGPEGKTCRDCAHYRSVNYRAKRYRKCALLEHAWTHGPGTDIKASSPACSLFAGSTDEL